MQENIWPSIYIYIYIYMAVYEVLGLSDRGDCSGAPASCTGQCMAVYQVLGATDRGYCSNAPNSEWPSMKYQVYLTGVIVQEYLSLSLAPDSVRPSMVTLTKAIVHLCKDL